MRDRGIRVFRFIVRYAKFLVSEGDSSIHAPRHHGQECAGVGFALDVAFQQNKFVKIKNNLGCCYRRLGDLKSAKKHLKEALKYAVDNQGVTLLNLCAIYS